MVKQAASNPVLYEQMLKAGYTDEEFPAWWYSPARGAGAAQEAKKEGEPAEGAEVSIKKQSEESEEGYDVTPPRQPASREGIPGRPTLPVPAHPSDAEPPVLPHADFSEAELSLLNDRGVTEITPGRWMHTEEQASGRIIARASVPT